jgi:hypothetical protein
MLQVQVERLNVLVQSFFAINRTIHSNMNKPIIHEGPRVEHIESPMRIPKNHEVVIKVLVVGCNPKDYKTY